MDGSAKGTVPPHLRRPVYESRNFPDGPWPYWKDPCFRTQIWDPVWTGFWSFQKLSGLGCSIHESVIGHHGKLTPSETVCVNVNCQTQCEISITAVQIRGRNSSLIWSSILWKEKWLHGCWNAPFKSFLKCLFHWILFLIFCIPSTPGISIRNTACLSG